MRKIYFLAGMAAMMLASCSSDKLGPDPTPSQPTLEAGAVGFDAYTQRGTTRAGAAGTLVTSGATAGQINLQDEGFGVFAYYTDANDYDPQATPNFMYNEQIKWDDTNLYWYYDNVKYWPNEYGNSAMSDEQDKVSFFAYAPYVQVTPATGKISGGGDSNTGITGLSRNSATGDPLVKYVASFDASKSVDLCWGTVPAGTTWATMEGVVSPEAGKPWVNVERAADATALSATTGQKVKFQFQHALAKFYVTIDAFVDGLDNTNTLGTNTHIWVRSVSFAGMATKGSLNLNNAQANKADWLDYNGTADLESGETVTIYDGRKDGKEGAAGSTAANEKTLGLNPVVISDDGNTKAGVTNTTVSLFASNQPFYVIPTGEPLEIEIVYDVETADPNLATYLSDGSTTGSSIENKIKQTITWSNSESKFESGKGYELHLHLGMNSVKFDAEVKDWDDTGNNADVHLPSNLARYAAGTAGTAAAITLPYDQTDYSFVVNGLDPSESVTWTATGVTDNSSDAAATAAGEALGKITLADNNTVNNVAGSMKAEGATSSKEITLNVTQAYHPLGPGASGTDGSSDIALTSTATGIAWATDVADPSADITIIKDPEGTSQTLTYITTPAADGDFTLDGANAKITLYTAAVSGDKYKITIKAGDAPAETVTITIP